MPGVGALEKPPNKSSSGAVFIGSKGGSVGPALIRSTRSFIAEAAVAVVLGTLLAEVPFSLGSLAAGFGTLTRLAAAPRSIFLTGCRVCMGAGVGVGVSGLSGSEPRSDELNLEELDFDERYEKISSSAASFSSDTSSPSSGSSL